MATKKKQVKKSTIQEEEKASIDRTEEEEVIGSTVVEAVAPDEEKKVEIQKVPSVKKEKKLEKDPTVAPPTVDQLRLGLRRKCRFYYDVQEMRMQCEGRLTRKAPNATVELHPDDLASLSARLKDLERSEDNALSILQDHLHQIDFYESVKSDPKYKGLGPRMWSVILSSFDIYRQTTVSKMWAFAGLAPIPAWRCKHCHIVMRVPGKLVSKVDDAGEYLRDAQTGKILKAYVEDLTGERYHPVYETKDKTKKCPHAGTIMADVDVYSSGKAARPIAGVRLSYNSWLRSKLCGVLAAILLKLGSPYRSFYDNYKHRKESEGWGVSALHRHKASMRYMIKMLLLDIWKEWREFEGLEVRGTYQEEYLKHIHHGKEPEKHPAVVNGLLTQDELTQLEVAEAIKQIDEESGY